MLTSSCYSLRIYFKIHLLHKVFPLHLCAYHMTDPVPVLRVQYRNYSSYPKHCQTFTESGKVVSKEIIYCMKPSSVHKQEKSWPHYLPRCLSQKPRDHAVLFPFFPPPTGNQRILSTLLSEEILTLCPFSLSCRHLRSGHDSHMRLQEAHYHFP